MTITTYSGLKTAIADWLNRADLDQKIPEFIRLAESTLNDVLRSADMVARSTSVTITSGRATLPADALEVVYAQVASSDDEPLEQITPQQLTMLRRTRTRDAANPRFFAIIGRDIVVTPTPASGSLDLDYYQRILFTLSFTKVAPIRGEWRRPVAICNPCLSCVTQTTVLVKIGTRSFAHFS